MGAGCLPQARAVDPLEKLVKPFIKVADYESLPAWRLTPRQVDKYFAGPGKHAPATVRQKLNRIRSAVSHSSNPGVSTAKLARQVGGVAVESPVDPFGPGPASHRDFGLRVPPSAGDLPELLRFVATRSLPGARKVTIASHNYTMAKIAYVSRVRAAELCPVKIPEDQLGVRPERRPCFVHGKGANGSGPRQREAYLFSEGRELLSSCVRKKSGQPRHRSSGAPEAPM